MWVRGLKQTIFRIVEWQYKVAPYVGAWIETSDTYDRVTQKVVAPYVGAWIETCRFLDWSRQTKVAPYVGAWIETDHRHLWSHRRHVAPYVGAWIETIGFGDISKLKKSHPMWVRGLKRLL